MASRFRIADGRLWPRRPRKTPPAPNGQCRNRLQRFTRHLRSVPRRSLVAACSPLSRGAPGCCCSAHKALGGLRPPFSATRRNRSLDLLFSLSSWLTSMGKSPPFPGFFPQAVSVSGATSAAGWSAAAGAVIFPLRWGKAAGFPAVAELHLQPGLQARPESEQPLFRLTFIQFGCDERRLHRWIRLPLTTPGERLARQRPPGA